MEVERLVDLSSRGFEPTVLPNTGLTPGLVWIEINTTGIAPGDLMTVTPFQRLRVNVRRVFSLVEDFNVTLPIRISGGGVVGRRTPATLTFTGSNFFPFYGSSARCVFATVPKVTSTALRIASSSTAECDVPTLSTSTLVEYILVYSDPSPPTLPSEKLLWRNDLALPFGDTRQNLTLFYYTRAPTLTSAKLSNDASTISLLFTTMVDTNPSSDLTASHGTTGLPRLARAGFATECRNNVIVAFNAAFSDSSSGTVAVAGPDTPSSPIVVMQGPEDIPVCGSVTIDLTQSSTGGGDVFTDAVFSVSPVTPGLFMPNLATFLSTQRNAFLTDRSTLTLPASLLNPGTYSISVSLKNLFGVTSTASRQFRILSSSSFPSVTVISPREPIARQHLFTSSLKHQHSQLVVAATDGNLGTSTVMLETGVENINVNVGGQMMLPVGNVKLRGFFTSGAPVQSMALNADFSGLLGVGVYQFFLTVKNTRTGAVGVSEAVTVTLVNRNIPVISLSLQKSPDVFLSEGLTILTRLDPTTVTSRTAVTYTWSPSTACASTLFGTLDLSRAGSGPDLRISQGALNPGRCIAASLAFRVGDEPRGGIARWCRDRWISDSPPLTYSWHIKTTTSNIWLPIGVPSHSTTFTSLFTKGSYQIRATITDRFTVRNRFAQHMSITVISATKVRRQTGRDVDAAVRGVGMVSVALYDTGLGVGMRMELRSGVLGGNGPFILSILSTLVNGTTGLSGVTVFQANSMMVLLRTIVTGMIENAKKVGRCIGETEVGNVVGVFSGVVDVGGGFNTVISSAFLATLESIKSCYLDGLSCGESGRVVQTAAIDVEFRVDRIQGGTNRMCLMSFGDGFVESVVDERGCLRVMCGRVKAGKVVGVDGMSAGFSVTEKIERVEVSVPVSPRFSGAMALLPEEEGTGMVNKILLMGLPTHPHQNSHILNTHNTNPHRNDPNLNLSIPIPSSPSNIGVILGATFRNPLHRNTRNRSLIYLYKTYTKAPTPKKITPTDEDSDTDNDSTIEVIELPVPPLNPHPHNPKNPVSSDRHEREEGVPATGGTPRIDLTGDEVSATAAAAAWDEGQAGGFDAGGGGGEGWMGGVSTWNYAPADGVERGVYINAVNNYAPPIGTTPMERGVHVNAMNNYRADWNDTDGKRSSSQRHE
ncbi:hypothetical protein BC829DRAFT_439375 [Chytridium lagenaria]|nr:hypothetical protein BC829DRAFT_439375 [Chytridium lagenaria]